MILYVHTKTATIPQRFNNNPNNNYSIIFAEATITFVPFWNLSQFFAVKKIERGILEIYTMK